MWNACESPIRAHKLWRRADFQRHIHCSLLSQADFPASHSLFPALTHQMWNWVSYFIYKPLEACNGLGTTGLECSWALASSINRLLAWDDVSSVSLHFLLVSMLTVFICLTCLLAFQLSVQSHMQENCWWNKRCYCFRHLQQKSWCSPLPFQSGVETAPCCLQVDRQLIILLILIQSPRSGW